MSAREICTITLIQDEDKHVVDIYVTSHPNGNNLEKIAKSLLDVFSAALRQQEQDVKT